MNKRYDTTSALIRYVAAVLTVVAFFMLFGTILYIKGSSGHIIELKFSDVFFGADGAYPAHVYGFIAQIVILLAGAFGVLIPIIGIFTENEKKLSYIVGGVLVVCSIIIILLKVFFPLSMDSTIKYHLYGTTIAAACLAFIAGGLNVWAAFIKE